MIATGSPSAMSVCRSWGFPAAALFATMLAGVPGTALAALPASCADIKAANPAAGDGTYWLFPNNQAFQVHCKDMGTNSPVEYLTLVNTAAGQNFSQYTAGGASPGNDVRTSYAKVRLNPSTLLVNVADQTFSTSSGSLLHSNSFTVSSMPYATAMDCLGSFSAAGLANIDLRGTPFAVADTFIQGGFLAGGSATLTNNSQVANLTGGGYCGWTQAAPGFYNPTNTNGDFQLNLAYIGGTLTPIAMLPLTDPAPIRVGRPGVIPVAVLSTPTFDATQVDPTTVKFGRTGTEASPDRFAVEDVNQDGVTDVVLFFSAPATGIQCGDTLALMTMSTFGGAQYVGAAEIKTIGCN